MSPPIPVLFNSQTNRIVEATCYTYESLGKSQIRLLKLLPGAEDGELECELKQTSLQTAPKYLALSYAWGNNDQDRRILVKRDHETWCEFMVTPNLLRALARLRHFSEIRFLWVDQVCIAQNDIEERNQQVQQMDLIYATAEKAVVWLGDDDFDTPLIQEMSERLTPWSSEFGDLGQMHLKDQRAVMDLIKPVNSETVSEATSAKARREAVVRFLGRAWFRRAWVYQEAIVAAEVEVYCGKFYVSFDILARMVLAIYYYTKIEEDGVWCKKIKKSKGFGPLRGIWYDRERYHKRKQLEPLDFLHVLWRARKYLEATKAEDFVYSFLAFEDLSGDNKIKANYGISPQETYTILARSMIRSRKSLDILQCLVPTKPPNLVGDKIIPVPHLTSWVPDWSNRRFTSGAPILCPGLTHKFDACRGKQHDWVHTDPQNSHILLVKGHIIDNIHKIVPHSCEGNTYFNVSLRECLKLDALITLLGDALAQAANELDRSKLDKENPSSNPKPSHNPKIHPRRRYNNISETALRTLLADGSFGDVQPVEQQWSKGTVEVEYSISELLRVYHSTESQLFGPQSTKDQILYRYIRDTGTIAEGKLLFLTSHLDVGLGYSNFRKGDLVVILYGSKAPCVLRRKSHQSKEYRFMGQCYLDGWMYGDNVRRYKWWEKEAKTFSIV